MTSDEAKLRLIGTTVVVKPTPTNPIIPLLTSYGLQPSQIIGRMYEADVFGDQFKDYYVVTFGVDRDDERLPVTRLYWEDAAGGFFCWQFQIYCRQHDVACVDATWREEYADYHVVIDLGDFSDLDMKVSKALHEGLRLLFLVSDRLVKGTRGGRRNVKVADLPEEVKSALGKRYLELKDDLTNVKREAKAIASTTSDWRQLILNKYSILATQRDLLDQIDPYPVPRDADASNRIRAPWEIAIEIAARETIPKYEPCSVSPDSLKRAAILPIRD